MGVRGSGGQEIGVSREVLGGQEAWKSGGLNSRIVTIIFETENLFFPRGRLFDYFCWGIRGAPASVHGWGQWSAGGLRVVWGRSGRTGFSDSRSRPALSQPGPGLRLSRRVCPAGCRRRPVRVPVPRPARAGALPRCAGAARRLSGRRPVPREPASSGGHVQAEALLPRPRRRTPCRAAASTYAIPPVQALPAGPGQSPRSRELQRLAARGRAAGSPAGAEYPRQPRAQVSSLRQAAVPRAMVLPRTLMPSERRGWRGPGAFPNAGPALALWSAQPGTIHSTAGEDGHRRPAVSHAPGEEVETRSESRSERGECGPTPVGFATRRQTPRPADLPSGGEAVASEGVEAAASHRLRGDGLSGGFVRRGVSASRIPKALSSPVVCHL